MDGPFLFVGGDPSLDLVNTLVHRRQDGGPDELLTDGEAALDWFVRAGLLPPGDRARLDPDTALASARRLRAALDAVYRPLAEKRDGGAAEQRGLDTLNAVLDQGRERLHVRRDGGRFERGSRFEVIGPLDPAVFVARSAADLLHRLEAPRLKVCENPECDLLFYDESRNNSRRWCAMELCGNQRKQARWRQNHRARADRP